MKLLMGSLLVLAVLASPVPMANAEVNPPDVSQDLITPGTLLVGSDIPYPPFEFETRSGYDGFDIDLVNALASKLKLRVVIKDTMFDTIFTDLSQGQFDLVASATTVTPERNRLAKFMRANYIPLQSLVVPRRSRIRSLRDLAGATVGVHKGTSGEAVAEDRTNAEHVVGFNDGSRVFRSLKRGRIDAIILDQPVVQDVIDRGRQGIRVAQYISTGDKYAFAVRKRSTDLLRGVNWAFSQVKADGTFRQIYRKWFGISPPAPLE